MKQAARPVYEGEPIEEARKRVKAAMQYFAKPLNQRKPEEAPTVNGFKLTGGPISPPEDITVSPTSGLTGNAPWQFKTKYDYEWIYTGD